MIRDNRLLIDGPNVQFTEAAQFLSTLSGRKDRQIVFRFEIETSMISDFFLLSGNHFQKGKTGIEIVEMTNLK